MKLKIRRRSTDKNERLSLRIPGEDKYALELLAKKRNTTISSLLMDLIRDQLTHELTVPISSGDKRGKRAYLPKETYDPLYVDRFVKLACLSTDFLSDEERIIWKVIKEEPYYWSVDEPNFKEIREDWDKIKKQAEEMDYKFAEG